MRWTYIGSDEEERKSLERALEKSPLHLMLPVETASLGVEGAPEDYNITAVRISMGSGALVVPDRDSWISIIGADAQIHPYKGYIQIIPKKGNLGFIDAFFDAEKGKKLLEQKGFSSK